MTRHHEWMVTRKLTFMFKETFVGDGVIASELVVRRLRPAPNWADGERLFGRIGGLGWLHGLFGKRVLLHFEGSVEMGKLVAVWGVRPRERLWSLGDDHARITGIV